MDAKHLALYLENQAGVLANLLKDVRRQPAKEQVHQLRVASRRIRATLDLLSLQPHQPAFPKLQRSMRRLGKVLGRERELDVAIRDAKHYDLDDSDLRKERKKARRVVRDWLDAKARKRISRRLNKMTLGLDRKAPPQLDKAIARQSAEWERWAHRSLKEKRQFHELRKAVKKMRYTLEAVGRSIQPLHKLQSLLGEAHDLEILQKAVKPNPKIRRDQTSILKEAKKRVQPTLHYARGQLERLNKPLTLRQPTARTKARAASARPQTK